LKQSPTKEKKIKKFLRSKFEVNLQKKKQPKFEADIKALQKKIEIVKSEVEGPTKRNSKVQFKKLNIRDLQKKSLSRIEKKRPIKKKSRLTSKNLQKKTGREKKRNAEVDKISSESN